MFLYIIRRTLFAIPVLLGVAFILFLIFNIVGGNPVYQMLGKHASIEEVHVLEQELGLDKPKYAQFFDFLKQIVTFDFGRSYLTKQKISTMIFDGLGPSLTLILPAFILGFLLALAIGLIVAFYRGRFIDRFFVVTSVMLMSISFLVYILACQYFLAYKLGWFPISGYEPGLFARFKYTILPGLIYVIVGLGADVRFFRTIFLNETSKDYIRTARSKGVSETKILFKHVLKNAMIPIVTQVVIMIPFLFLGSLLLENFFQIPGIGSVIVNAIQSNDYPVIKAMTMIGAILFIVANILGDVFYSVLDPRIRLK